mmetsp:Transcript_77684/g.214689  ORF Transcript_77684/g.214689 Transcript_77684/m.214689 type:complete len:103 (-) Transcript_77684:7-315(-)
MPVTRCFGNLVGHQFGMIHVPEVNSYDLDPNGDHTVFAILATDGMWSMLKDAEILAIMKESWEDNLQYAIDSLVERAKHRWEQRAEGFRNVVDDITVVVLRL